MPAHPTDPTRDPRDARFAAEARFFVDMLQFSRLVLLYGEPGAGKSTLLRDWVIPALRADSLPGETRHIVYFDGWNDTPLAALDAQIEATLPEEVRRRSDTPTLHYGPWADRLGAWTAQPGHGLVLVLDHFERLLAAKGEGVDAFVREWSAAMIAPRLPVQCLIALRSAAEPLLMQRFAGRIPALGDNRVVLPAPRKAKPAPARGRRPAAVSQAAASDRAGVRTSDRATTRASDGAPGRESDRTSARSPVAAALARESVASGPARQPAASAPTQAQAVPGPVVVHGDTRAFSTSELIARATAVTVPLDAGPPLAERGLDRGASSSPVEPVLAALEPASPPPLAEVQRPAARPAPAQAQAQAPSNRAAGFDATPGRREPRFDLGESATREAPRRAPAAPPDTDVRSAPAARAYDFGDDDDLFGPEPERPVFPRQRGPSLGRRIAGWIGMVGALAAAAFVASLLLAPTDDHRVPLRARAPDGKAGAAPQMAAPAQGAPTGAGPVEDGTPGTAARAVSPAALAAPSDVLPRATNGAPEVDAAIVIARDVSGVLAGEGNKQPVRSGIGATAALGPRLAGDLFVARYDVLDAMRTADSGDSRNIDGLRLLAPLQVEPFYFVVRRDEPISFVHEIGQRRINVGAGGTDAALGAAHLYRRMFDASLGSQRTSYLPDAEALTALVRERSVDVAVLLGRAGFSALVAQQRATPGVFKLLVFDPTSAAGRRAMRSYLSVEVPPSPGNAWLDRRLPALAVMSFLVGRGLDDDRASHVVRTLCQQRGRLRSTGHPYWLSIALNPVNAPGWRYAAGAERELRACSARWSAGPDGNGTTRSNESMVSRLDEKVRAQARAAASAPR